MRWINKVKIAIVLIIAFVLIGCVNNNVVLDPKAKNIKPFMTVLSNHEGLREMNVFYAIDNRTGVVYLGFSGNQRERGLQLCLILMEAL